MDQGDLLTAIHTDVRETRARVDALANDISAVKAGHEERLKDLEAHIAHSGPTKWDLGSLASAIGAILVAALQSRHP